MTDTPTPNPETGTEPAPPKRQNGWLWPAVIVAVLVGGGAWVWNDYVRDRVVPKRFGVVEEKLLFRSGQLHPALVEDVLRERGIDLVIDMTRLMDDDPYQQAELEACQKLGIEQLRLPLGGDGTGEPKRYIEALAAIDEKLDHRQQVLVHCSAGSQRTGGVIALYRLLFDGWSRDRIVDEMKRYDWDDEKDRVLLKYLDQHLPEIVAGLVERGVLERMPETLPKFAEPGSGE